MYSAIIFCVAGILIGRGLVYFVRTFLKFGELFAMLLLLSILPILAISFFSPIPSVLLGSLSMVCSTWYFSEADPIYEIAKVIDHKRIHFSLWLIAGVVGGIYLPEKWFSGYSYLGKALFFSGTLSQITEGLFKSVMAGMLTLLTLGIALACFSLLMGMAEEVIDRRKNAQAISEIEVSEKVST